jgi:hypothetical protein
LTTDTEKLAFHLISMHGDVFAIARSFPGNTARHYSDHLHIHGLLFESHYRSSLRYDENRVEDLLEGMEE